MGMHLLFKRPSRGPEGRALTRACRNGVPGRILPLWEIKGLSLSWLGRLSLEGGGVTAGFSYWRHFLVPRSNLSAHHRNHPVGFT
jgi:hypothetical protein